MRRSQTGLPSDVTTAVGDPSYSYGFSKPGGINRGAGFTNDPLGSDNRFTSSTVIANTTARVLIGANPRRNYLLIQNNGTVTIFVGFGSLPSLQGNNALVLPPNTGITFETGIVPNNDVSVIASTECRVTVVEGLRM